MAQALPDLPDLAHLSSPEFRDVYEPQEDSFFLMDALAADADWLERHAPSLCVEIGSGSGCAITHLHNLLARRGLRAVCMATDTNPVAARCTLATARLNAGAVVLPVQTYIAESLLPRLRGKVDVVVCNPPYVPTDADELDEVHAQHGACIAAAWAGGKDGREVIDNILPQAVELLSEKGTFYLLLVQENKPAEVVALLKTHGLKHKTLLKRRAHNELLYVIRFSRE